MHAGDIVWHAMPFNTQVELLDAPLLQYAIEMTHELDARFGQPPKRTMSQVMRAAGAHFSVPDPCYCPAFIAIPSPMRMGIVSAQLLSDSCFTSLQWPFLSLAWGHLLLCGHVCCS